MFIITTIISVWVMDGKYDRVGFIGKHPTSAIHCQLLQESIKYQLPTALRASPYKHDRIFGLTCIRVNDNWTRNSFSARIARSSPLEPGSRPDAYIA